MKKTIFVLLISSFLFGCNVLKKPDASSGKVDNTTNSATNNSAPNAETAMSAGDVEAQKVLGSYVGPFGDNKITLLVTTIGGGTVSGRSIVGGNDRPFDGTYTVENASYKISAREPGDHKDDGVFNFSISANDPSKATGT